MSGGTFDYIQYRLTDAVDEIKRRLNRNHKTIIENWNSLSDEERHDLWEYEQPWSVDNHPYWVEDEAVKKADEAILSKKSSGKNLKGIKSFNKLTQKERDKWNEVRLETLNQLIEDHNNSYLGEDYSDETVAKIKEMIHTIRLAEIYLQRIDWLFAGDDGEDSFKERTAEEVAELEKSEHDN